ncbi:MAG: GGDEF domain-containing protein [Thiomicrorhabdus sp.]|nr:GGDEF domain-containing protein [Thiomicrorhabdus sp.]
MSLKYNLVVFIRFFLKIENTRINQSESKLEHLATTDYLTGIANRRSAIQFAQSEFKRASRYKTHFSCIMCDIDCFKHVNDKYDHDIGDKTLIAFTQSLSEELRPSDLIARLGGEEFLILLPETPLTHAIKLAERLCKKNIQYSN